MASIQQQRTVLTSWKEIAAYLGKGVRTVQRWECEFGLPVRRPNGGYRRIVHATVEELDDWLANWSQRLNNEAKGAAHIDSASGAVQASQQLRDAHRQLRSEVALRLDKLAEICGTLRLNLADSRPVRREAGAIPTPTDANSAPVGGTVAEGAAARAVDAIHTGPHAKLPADEASLKVHEMVRPGLNETQSAVEEARKDSADTGRPNTLLMSGDCATAIRVNLSRTHGPYENDLLVALETSAASELPPTATVTPLGENSEDRLAEGRQMAQLNQELAVTREHLQSIVGALEFVNEELRASRNELESVKNELESANEELHLFNEELRHRNEQVAQLNSDFANLLASVNLPIVMVGPALLVRRFSPRATDVLGLTAADIGQPVTSLRLRIEVANLGQMIRDVLSQARPMRQLVRNRKGDPCDLRLSPAFATDGRIDGVVLSVLGFDHLDDATAAQKSA